jgi:biopolymer transport protein ExbD
VWSAIGRVREIEARRRGETYCRLDMSIFAVVFFVLWVALLLGYHPPRRALFDAAVTDNSQPFQRALREDAILVTITRDGGVYLRRREVGSQGLPQAIGLAIEKGSERRIYLMVDARTHYGDVKPVIDQIHRSGISDVVLITRGPNESAPILPASSDDWLP